MKTILSLLMTSLISQVLYSQLSDSLLLSQAKIPPRYYQATLRKASQIENNITRKTQKALKQFSRQEEKLYHKLYKIDSLAAKEIFARSKQQIANLQAKLKKAQTLTPGNIKEYIPALDSQITTLKFLDKYTNQIPQKEKINTTLAQLQNMQSKLQSATEIKQYLKQRRDQLKEQLSKFGFAKELKKLNKQVYYYQAQINEYKQILKDPRKIEKKALAQLSKLSTFQQFMKKNSMLASLFRMPDDGLSPFGGGSSLAGLQTRADIQNLVQNQFTGTGINPRQYIQQQMQQAQTQLNKLK
ncbi:MAG TPA: hypothetical protein VFN30_07930, partial [Chitinophagaceae bacterium]|nr:hypothetical protein [Chitinophagaceae bacterium]